MSSILQRSMKVAAVGWVLGAALVAGCSVTTGGAALTGSTTGFAVCSGGHASRFPSREEVGRVCQHSSALRTIY
jgi:hypothetical protein